MRRFVNTQDINKQTNTYVQAKIAKYISFGTVENTKLSGTTTKHFERKQLGF